MSSLLITIVTATFVCIEELMQMSAYVLTSCVSGVSNKLLYRPVGW